MFNNFLSTKYTPNIPNITWNIYCNLHEYQNKLIDLSVILCLFMFNIDIEWYKIVSFSITLVFI